MLNISDIEAVEDWDLESNILNSFRILIVEDEKSSSSLCQDLLETHGCYVEVSHSVPDAIERLGNAPSGFD